MNYEEFKRYIVEHVLDGWREELSAEIKEIPKNNGTVMHGLFLTGGSSPIIPVLYFDEMYRAYQRGVTTQAIIAGIRYEYENAQGKFLEEDLEIEDFEKVHDRIMFQLTGYEKNQQMLSEVPHIQFLDMAIIFKVVFRCNDPERLSAYMIRNRDLACWGISVEELYALALANTPRIAPARVLGMDEMFEKNGKNEGTKDTGSLTILSNQFMTHGSGVILYPDFLKKYAGRVGANLYLIPSSIHEILVLPETVVEDEEELMDIIHDVNRSELEEADILSDSLYFYHRDTDRIDIVNKRVR